MSIFHPPLLCRVFTACIALLFTLSSPCAAEDADARLQRIQKLYDDDVKARAEYRKHVATLAYQDNLRATVYQNIPRMLAACLRNDQYTQKQQIPNSPYGIKIQLASHDTSSLRLALLHIASYSELAHERAENSMLNARENGLYTFYEIREHADTSLPESLTKDLGYPPIKITIYTTEEGAP